MNVEADCVRQPAISVCVPLYNGAAFLEECLQAIVDQEFEDFEVLILDDCSSDDGPAIARRFVEGDKRFRFVANDRNLGLVGNWNECIRVATGRWIKFLFQDDVMDRRCLSTLIVAGEGGCGFVAAARKLIYEPPISAAAQAWYEQHAAIVAALYADRTYLARDDYIDAKLLHPTLNLVGEPSVTLIAKHLFARVGLFDPLLAHLCDSEMWTRIASNVGVDYVAKPLVSFRVHAGAASAKFAAQPFRGATLDVIVEAYKQLNDPPLDHFRHVATRLGKLEGVRELLSGTVNRAFDEIRNDRKSGDAAIKRRDLAHVLKRLMGARRAHAGHVVYRIRRLLGFRVGSSSRHDRSFGPQDTPLI